MKTKWYHFETEIPPAVEAEGAEAIAAYEATVFKDRAQAEFGCTFPELRALVETEQATVLEEIAQQDAQAKAAAAQQKKTWTPVAPKDAETRRRTALDAAKDRVFGEIRRDDFDEAEFLARAPEGGAL